MTNKSEENKLEIAKKLNVSVTSVITNNGNGFEKAYLIATAIGELKQVLSPEYMKPIMFLQGNGNGFKTDKDKAGGYTEEEVKNCLIEAVLKGVEPYGNQFNIISGNCYITKEGFGHLLKNTTGLKYEIIPSLPRITADKAAVLMKIRWSMNGGTETEREIDFPIKVNSYMGADGVIGKATRKARAWLYNTIHNVEIADGDVETEARVISSKPLNVDKEEERIDLLIQDANTPEDMDFIKPQIPEKYINKWKEKMELIKPTKK